MARMHSRKRGNARSTRPAKRTTPSWMRYKKREAELLFVKLAKEGNTASKIGMVLRDVYGIPDAKLVLGMSISKSLEEHSIKPQLPEDLTALIRKASWVVKHLEKNKHDQTAARGLLLTESKIKRLAKYYKRESRIAEDWRWDRAKASMFAE